MVKKDLIIPDIVVPSEVSLEYFENRIRNLAGRSGKKSPFFTGDFWELTKFSRYSLTEAACLVVRDRRVVINDYDLTDKYLALVIEELIPVNNSGVVCQRKNFKYYPQTKEGNFFTTLVYRDEIGNPFFVDLFPEFLKIPDNAKDVVLQKREESRTYHPEIEALNIVDIALSINPSTQLVFN